MRSNIQNAIAALDGHSVSLCKGGDIITRDGRGVSPLMGLMAEGCDVRGYSAADTIVGKAAALLMAHMGIAEVYGAVMSQAAADTLGSLGIPYSFGTLTDRIINRAGDDICPMEKTVSDISDPAKAYEALRVRIAQMKK